MPSLTFASLKIIFAASLLLLAHAGRAQFRTIVVADSQSHRPLAFSTIQFPDTKKSIIADIDGLFRLSSDARGKIVVSYTGYKPASIQLSGREDSIFLAPASKVMDEVIVRSQSDKVRRIINNAVRNKNLHNPENLDWYSCAIYYKMNADLGLLGLPPRRDTSARQTRSDKSEEEFLFSQSKHLLFSESYTRRTYKKPRQLQEEILASRFSGLKKTYFTNIVTEVVPFHTYDDFIKLNGTDYSNPVSVGWQGRYRFFLWDELYVDQDTVFVLAFEPRAGKIFNALRGTVYINSDGFAISHFVANSGDSASDRNVKIEQIYEKRDGHWFPKELNYAMSMKHVPSYYTELDWSGHSVLSEVTFREVPVRFDKAHTVRFGDSIDSHTASDWERFRKDTISRKEALTYRFMDSIGERYHFDQIMQSSARLIDGKLPIGIFDLDLTRIIARNPYEKYRIGAGLYTNARISKHYSLGGWAGWGTRDNVWKYGTSLTIFPMREKESWIKTSYENSYRSPGQTMLHPDLDKSALRNWALDQVDQYQEISLQSNWRLGYWEIRTEASRTELKPLYPSVFDYNGKLGTEFSSKELSLGFRYAFGEKRVPVFDNYRSLPTNSPVYYVKAGLGNVSSPIGYNTSFIKIQAAITFGYHLNRWGKDRFKIEGGIVETNGNALPRSFLMAGNGLRWESLQFYTWGAFMTIRPFDYFSDRFASLYYRHDFDRYLWELKTSKPFISLSHNMVFGSLATSSKVASVGIQSFESGYHESGIMLNNLLRANLHFASVGISAGLFYHWNGGPFKETAIPVIGFYGNF